MEDGNYYDMISKSALRKEEPSLDALEELIKMVEIAIETLKQDKEEA